MCSLHLNQSVFVLCVCDPYVTDFAFSLAQPCMPQLEAPQNGSILCSGDQVTDQNCSFACDAGFTFSGSELKRMSIDQQRGLELM